MALQNWSENIVVVDLQDDPAFSDDINALTDAVTNKPQVDVVLDLAGVSYLNSSNIAALLKIRKQVVVTNQRKLKLCGLSNHVWGLFLVTGLEKVFDFEQDIALGLASVQIDRR